MSAFDQYGRSVRAIILTPILDFGRCRLASHMPAALWPVAGRPALTRLLANLCEQGVGEAVICAYGEVERLKKTVENIQTMRLRFLEERFPAGNAGCIRDAWDGRGDRVLVVLQAATISLPDIDSLLATHEESGAHLTVIFGSHGGKEGRTPELYVCDPEAVGYIPRQGYFDIKEGLIPAMVRSGQMVNAGYISGCTCGFRDRQTYLSALGQWLSNGASEELKSLGLDREASDLWLAPRATVHADVAAHGPVVILDGARVSAGAILFGPTIIEPDVTIGPGAVIDGSALWSGAMIGPNCHIRASVIGGGAVVPAGAVVEQEVVLPARAGRALTRWIGRGPKARRAGVVRPSQVLCGRSAES